MLYNVLWINYFDDTDMCRIKHIIDSSDRMCKEQNKVDDDIVTMSVTCVHELPYE